MNRPSYYSIIPARVRYSDLKPNAKLLYGEISSLTHKEGYCYAQNKYFAELYNVSKNTISLWIAQLHRYNFIVIKMIYSGKQIIERRIYINEINEGINKKEEGAIIKKVEDNITRLNTKNNINKRKLEFEEIVFQVTDISKDDLQNFVDYWTETNKSNTKMKFEMERTFDINLRLKRWMKNKKNWYKPQQKSKIENAISTHQKAKEMIQKMNINGKY